MVDYEVIDEEAWQKVAPPEIFDDWDKILDLLAQGKYVRVSYKDERERRIAMINLQRRATRRGLILYRRLANGHLYYGAKHVPGGARATQAVEGAR